MEYPQIVCHKDRFLNNVSVIAELLHKDGRTFSMVTKGFAANPELMELLENSPADWFADSRVDNLASMHTKKPRFLIRIAQPWETEEVVRHCEVSLESEIGTIRLLNEAALKLGRRHGVIVAVDMGDLREGCFFEDLEDVEQTVQAVVDAEGLELLGIGTNLGCYGGVKTTPVNMKAFVELGKRVENDLGIKLRYLSGLTSAAHLMLYDGTMPKEVNHGRFGESIVAGFESVNHSLVKGTSAECFTLRTQVVEVKTKPSMPIGELGGNAFGEVASFEDKGLMRRAIVACGAQDTELSYLTPADPRMHILGCSSDHIELDVTEAPEVKLGDIIEFNMRYKAVLRAYTSAYVRKVIE